MNVPLKKHDGSFLPDIRQSSTQHRVKQQKETPQILSKEETARITSSLKQNICVEMLQEGFHRSYSELFFLLLSDQSRRSADFSLAVQLQTPLDQHQDKLETIRRHLSSAEQAERSGYWLEVCKQRMFLGRFFSAPEDRWLSLHFYHSCADIKQGSRLTVEARACLAEIYLQQGKLEQAKQQAELCINQAEFSGWMDSGGQPLRLRALRALSTIYTGLAAASLDAADYGEGLKLLHQSCSIATESEDKHSEAGASYQLGLGYQRAGDHTAAKQFFNRSMQMCGTLQDTEGLGKCYKAMAKSLHSEGNDAEAIRFLEKLVDICVMMPRQLVEAFLSLGHVYFTQGQYERASEFFLKSYELSCDLDDVALLQEAQVWVGSARAHSTVREYLADDVDRDRRSSGTE
ncbi:Tetratricopeptide repeat protein 29 [Larimichthys crocea]|uniref:Tetratricopeptide repeat protein 29 n=1 Tax=Larimichthys crocea TaxID=215358 RepID=A0A6G0HK19_LARCR|nr:Tetratricopeptide repeat protein 29 [Larimichthys crocea]